jgi:LRR receptor-like serine/threonine-protein kinase FLS2
VPDLSALGPSLVGLDLGNNKFSGLLPASISKLRSLFVLSLRDNSFWGPVGDALTNLTSLQFVCV